jgi:hypothetical protein
VNYGAVFQGSLGTVWNSWRHVVIPEIVGWTGDQLNSPSMYKSLNNSCEVFTSFSARLDNHNRGHA